MRAVTYAAVTALAAAAAPLSRSAAASAARVRVPLARVRVSAGGGASAAMSTHAASKNEHGDAVLEPTSGRADSCVIWMHGLGDTADGWVDSVADAVAPSLRHTRFVLPTAPTRPITVNGGMAMPGWYDITSLSRHVGSDTTAPHGLAASVARVDALVAAQGRKGIPPGRVVVAGFSQGGAMALYTALRHGSTLAGALVMSGYLPHASGVLDGGLGPAQAATPVLMLHGGDDPLVLPEYGRESADAVRAAGGADVVFKLYPGVPHSVTPRELRDATVFLAARLPPLPGTVHPRGEE